MCANDEAGRRSFADGAVPRDEDRYGAFELETEGTVIYDAENDAAWIQSTVATSLAVRR